MNESKYKGALRSYILSRLLEVQYSAVGWVNAPQLFWFTGLRFPSLFRCSSHYFNSALLLFFSVFLFSVLVFLILFFGVTSVVCLLGCVKRGGVS